MQPLLNTFIHRIPRMVSQNGGAQNLQPFWLEIFSSSVDVHPFLSFSLKKYYFFNYKNKFIIFRNFFFWKRKRRRRGKRKRFHGLHVLWLAFRKKIFLTLSIFHSFEKKPFFTNKFLNDIQGDTTFREIDTTLNNWFIILKVQF